jgi:hypothetical protein
MQLFSCWVLWCLQVSMFVKLKRKITLDFEFGGHRVTLRPAADSRIYRRTADAHCVRLLLLLLLTSPARGDQNSTGIIGKRYGRVEKQTATSTKFCAYALMRPGEQTYNFNWKCGR